MDEYTGRRFTFCADPAGLPLELCETGPQVGPSPTRRYPCGSVLHMPHRGFHTDTNGYRFADNPAPSPATDTRPGRGYMRKTVTTLLLALPLALAGITAAQADNTSAEGRWRQIDPDTHRAKSIVEISRTGNGTLNGRIVELLNPSRPNPTCDKCSDDRKNKPITGMEIIRNMRADGTNKWSGGSILKPDEGKVYKSKMELIEGGSKLQVSGCIVFLCKSQVWERM